MMRRGFEGLLQLSILSILLFGSTGEGLACSLPVDPDICIVLNDASNYNGPGPQSNSFTCQEDTTVTWHAYWNATEFDLTEASAGFVIGSPDANFDGQTLYSLEKYIQACGGGHIKVKEIQERVMGNNDWQQNPRAPIEFDAPVKNSTLTCSGAAGSAFGASTIDQLPASGDVSPDGRWLARDVGWSSHGGRWNLSSFNVEWDLNVTEEVWAGDNTTSEDYTVDLSYPTPTGNESRIMVQAEAYSHFEYNPDGAEFKWTEVELDPDTGEETGNEQYFSVTMAGSIEKSSDEGSDEYDYAWLHVEDISSPQHYKMSPETLQARVGKEITDAGNLQVKVLENDPYCEEVGPLTGFLCYSTMNLDWQQLDGEKTLCQEAPDLHPHAHYCDCQAYHEERWVWKNIPLRQTSVEQVNHNGSLAYAVVTMEVDGEIEAVPWHYAEGANSYSFESADYSDYAPYRLKHFVVVADARDLGYLAPPFDYGSEDSTAEQVVSLSDPVSIGAVSGVPQEDAMSPPTGMLLGEIAASGEAWGSYGSYGGVEVEDDERPNIRVFVTNSKYNWTHLFGHDDALDGSLDGYKSAKEGGSGSSDSNEDSPYLDGEDAPEEWVFNTESDYFDQLEMIRVGGFAPSANIVEGAPWGLWVDEDTRLIFKVVCRDNINPWERENGIPFEVEMVDGPAGVTLSGDDMGITDDGVFEYLFRDPNRGENAINRDCKLSVDTVDDYGNRRKMTIYFYVASNELKLQTLEEQRERNEDW